MATRRIVKEPTPKLAILKALKQPVYDTETQSAAATVARLSFFTRPEGQNDNAAVVKTRHETNLATSGQLPKPKYMDLYGFRIKLLNRNAVTGPAAPIAFIDTYAMLFRARFLFRVGDIDLLEVPLDDLPQGVGFAGAPVLDAAAAPTDRPVYTRGTPSIYEVMDVTVGRKPKRISHGEQIQAVVEWHAGAPVLTQDTGIRVSLIGILYPAVG